MELRQARVGHLARGPRDDPTDRVPVSHRRRRAAPAATVPAPAAPTRRRSSRTSRPRPSWAATASAASARCAPRTWATFDDLTFLPCTPDPHPAGGLPRDAASTRTVLGTRFAEKPIELDIPIMITGHELRRPVVQRQGGPRPRRAPASASSTTTGDGGMLPAERENSRMLIYEVLPSRYGINVHHLRQADAIELTIGQGAKPGTGGLLLGSKVSAEIARHARPAARRRPAQPGAAPGLPRPGRHDHQDRGAARGDRLAGADLRQARRQPRLRRRQAGRQGRRRRGRRRRHGRRHRRLARTCSRSTPASRRWPRSARPARRWRSWACTARCS